MNDIAVIPGPVLLRPEEAGRMLGVGRSMVFELLRTGRLESVRIGRARRIPVAAVEAFVARVREEQAVGA